MIYKLGNMWKIQGVKQRFKTKKEAEAYAGISQGHIDKPDSTRVVAESTDRWVHEPVVDTTDSSPDWNY